MYGRQIQRVAAVVVAFFTAACARAVATSAPASGAAPAPAAWPAPPSPDPRVGLRAGVNNAEEAIWNMRLLSKTPPPRDFVNGINSDLAFTGQHAIQGSFNGFQVWDISNPALPAIVRAFLCPASQSDVSVYRNLLFVSGEDNAARLDCDTQGVNDSVPADRFRGIRIFDTSDIRNPRNVGNVQTCRGSHPQTVVADPRDRDNVYIYVSGSAPVRPARELAGCSSAPPDRDSNTALFRIEVIRVPLANLARAEIVNSPRIFAGLVAPATHGAAPEDLETLRIIHAIHRRFSIEGSSCSSRGAFFCCGAGNTQNSLRSAHAPGGTSSNFLLCVAPQPNVATTGVSFAGPLPTGLSPRHDEEATLVIDKV